MPNSPVPVTRSAPERGGTPDIWRSLRGEMDRLFDRFTSGFGLSPFPAFGFEREFVASPAVDITEDDKSFTLSAELPGMSEKDIQVSLAGDTLTIKGEKRKERDEKNNGAYLMERTYGEFRRSFILPDGVDSDKIVAKFANGVLTLTLPKTARVAPKQIEVKTAA